MAIIPRDANRVTTLAGVSTADGTTVVPIKVNPVTQAIKIDLTAVRFSLTTSSNPAANAATSTSNVDNYGGVVITLTGAGNAQTLQTPTDTTAGKIFVVINNDTSTHSIAVNSITLNAGQEQGFIWDGSVWIAFESTKVNGPASSTDNAVARYDGITGRIIQNSGITISDTDDLTVPGDLTVNGTTVTLNTSSVNVEDKNILINKGGTTAGAVGSGISIEGDAAAVVGYVQTGAADNSIFELKTPGNAGVLTVDINATKTLTIAGSLNIEADSNINQDLSSDSTTATFGTLTTTTHVNGLGSVGAPSYTFTGNTSNGIYSSGANILDFTTNGVNRLSITTSGISATVNITTTGFFDLYTGGSQRGIFRLVGDPAVEITTSDAAYNLNLSTTGNARLIIAPTGVITMGTSGIFANVLGAVGAPSYTFTGNTSNGWWSPGADTQAWSTAGVERMRIDSAGKVGIGMTPIAGYTLTVDTSVTNGLIFYANDSTITSTQNLGQIAFGGLDTTSDDNSALIEVFSPANWSDTSHPSTMNFYTTAINSISPTERIRITSEGLVGINTTPSRPLHVKGNGLTNGTNPLRISSDGAEVSLQIASDTTNPCALQFGDSGSDTAGEIRYVHASDYMVFTTGTSERMRIDSAGKVGIGMTPNYKLDINGSAQQINITSSTAYNASPVAEIGMEFLYQTGSPTATTGNVFIKAGKENTTDGNYDSFVSLLTRPNGGSVTERMRISSTGLITIGNTISPSTNDVAALGTSSLMFSDLFLASGGVVNFNNGDVTITHGSNTLAFAGATSAGYSFDSSVALKQMAWRVSKNSTQTISTNTWTAVTWQVEEYDIESTFTLASQYWTVPYTGLYFISCNLRIGGQAIGADTYFQTMIAKNNSSPGSASGSTQLFVLSLGAQVGDEAGSNGSSIYNFTAGDKIHLEVYATDGGDILNSSIYSWMSCMYLGQSS